MTIRALTVRQPWAGLIAAGIKTIELRTWSTTYRGLLLIIAGKGASNRDCLLGDLPPECATKGAALCLVTLVDVRSARHEDRLHACIEPGGGYAWIVRDPILIEPIELRGSLGLPRINAPQLTGQIEQILSDHHLRI